MLDPHLRYKERRDPAPVRPGGRYGNGSERDMVVCSTDITPTTMWNDVKYMKDANSHFAAYSQASNHQAAEIYVILSRVCFQSRYGTSRATGSCTLSGRLLQVYRVSKGMSRFAVTRKARHTHDYNAQYDRPGTSITTSHG